MIGHWRNAAALPLFFALKVASGLIILKVSAVALPVAGFSVFSQFLLFAALLNVVATGGAQYGLIRQVSVALSDDEVARAQSAAFAMWMATALLIGVPLVLARGWVSIALVGTPSAGWAVPPIVALMLLGGLGQVACSVLTGLGRVAGSLAAQGIGLAVALAGCLAALAQGEALWGVIAFSAGPFVAGLVAFPLARAHRFPLHAPRQLVVEIRALLRFSGATMALALFTPFILFAIRYLYREQFGIEALAFWLVANRISDTSVQLMGLYAYQLFIPRYAAIANPFAARRVLMGSWAILTAVMALFLGIFALAPELIVRVILSSRYLPAIGVIEIYMLGDVFRATVMIAMHQAFARAQLRRYVMIEVYAMVLFAVITVILLQLGEERAPFLGYTLAYGVMAAGLACGRWWRRPAPEGAPPEGRTVSS